jgi:hypothetical protein
MYLDIEPNTNLPEGGMATFKESGPGREITAVKLWRDGAWQWCAVTGLGPTGAVPARLTPIEESGDGPACLITGGAHGVRLAVLTGAAVAWSCDNAQQWSEPFLICRPEVETRA